MIYILIDYLQKVFGWKVPLVFSYTSTRMILAAITTLSICIFLGPWFIRKLQALNIGQTVRTDECPHLGELHKKKSNTPTMGGLLLLVSMVVSLLLWMDLTHVFTVILLLTTLVLGVMGGVDDYLKLRYKNTKGLRGRYKLATQVVLSLLIALYLFSPAVSGWVQHTVGLRSPVVKDQVIVKIDGEPSKVSQFPITTQEYGSRVYVPFLKEPVVVFSGIGLILAILFTILVITGSSNAVNLTDGLDGLATGCLLIVAIPFTLIAFFSNHLEISRYLHILYIEGSGEIAVFLSAFIGACLGFLWYNGYPAEVFMGDTGSLTLGGIIGVSAVLLKREILLALVGGIFVAEALSVIIQVVSYRFRNKKRVFLCAPLHHHFEYKGWPETKVVIRFWIISLVLAIFGVASLKFQ